MGVIWAPFYRYRSPERRTPRASRADVRLLLGLGVAATLNEESRGVWRLHASVALRFVTTMPSRTSRKAVYIMIERRQLPGLTRVGRRVLIKTSSLLEWLDQQSSPSLVEDQR